MQGECEHLYVVKETLSFPSFFCLVKDTVFFLKLATKVAIIFEKQTLSHRAKELKVTKVSWFFSSTTRNWKIFAKFVERKVAGQFFL